jgi:exopolyphosphatase/guanosine-5'-triphosphate,3'-diphosphate pyrophosphatase
MRVAVVDLGTNSTRLLVADVTGDGAVTELERRARVTRLGDGVERTGVLADDAMHRVLAALDEYSERIAAHGASRTVGVLTSAVRDAANGAAFTARVRDGYGIDARTIGGDEEARLTFLGATSERPPDDATPTVVIDIGGGSTELVVGTGHEVTFHVSTRVGVVRHTERHLAADPPARAELDALAADVRGTFEHALPATARDAPRAAIAVAGTATSLGAIDLDLDYRWAHKAHGHRLALARCETILARLARMTDAERRHVRGLHPDRAQTIVAGTAVLIEALRAFGLDCTEVSDQDILRGAALDLVQQGPRAGTRTPTSRRAGAT